MMSVYSLGVLDGLVKVLVFGRKDLGSNIPLTWVG